MSESSLNKQTLHILLQENSFEKYDCEFKEYFSNHISHGIIALYWLGATETQVRSYIKIYMAKLRPPKICPSSNLLIDDLIGKKSEFERVRKHYIDLNAKQNGLWKATLNKVFPELYEGLLGSLLHPVIHVGYGIAVDSAVVVTDGLAYMHFSYLAKSKHVDDSHFGNGSLSIIDVLNEIRKDEMFLLRVKEQALNHKPLLGSKRSQIFQALFHDEVNALTKYVNMIKIPANIDLSSLCAIRQSMDELLALTIEIYLCCDHLNDFYLLHGVTGLYALKQIILHLNDYEVAKNAVRVFITALVCVYISVKCPKLRGDYELKAPDDFEVAWKDLINEVLRKEDSEHAYKLVHICKELYGRTNSIEKKTKCFMAAKIVLENKYTRSILD